jgi:hypothetical protein
VGVVIFTDMNSCDGHIRRPAFAHSLEKCGRSSSLYHNFLECYKAF